MVDSDDAGPWGATLFDEVHLKNAPLERVLCQVRFPNLTRLAADPAMQSEIALALADEYPVFNEGHEITIQFGPEGIVQGQGEGKVWNLTSGDGGWQVSTGTQFVALASTKYTSREDFTERLKRVVDVVASIVSVPHCDRIGFRYTNRVHLDEIPLGELNDLLRPVMRGGLGVPLSGQKPITAMNEALYDMSPPDVPAGTPVELTDGVQARWGLLPAGGQIDLTLPAYGRSTWVLDIDSFRSIGRNAPPPSLFTASQIGDQVTELAGRGYQFFRWAVTAEFLDRFGAQA